MRARNRRPVWVLITALALLLTVTACAKKPSEQTSPSTTPSQGTDQATQPAASEPKEIRTVRVVFPRAKELAGEDVYLHIAQTMGYAAENGITFQFESAIGTTDSTKLVATRGADVGYPSPFVSITARSTGLPIKSVYDTLQTNIFGFGVRPDSSIQTIADLKGKKVALGDGGWTIIAAPLLKSAGLTTDDVEWVVAGERRQLSVWQGDTDAVLTWEMEYQNWANQGITLRVFGQDSVDFQSNGLVVADDLIKQDPDMVRAIVRSAAMGAEFSITNPEAAAEIALKTFPGVTPKTYPGMVEVVKSLNGLMKAPWTEEKGYGYHLADAWNTEIKDLYDAGVIKQMITAEDVTTNEFIAYANDFDHERVRKDARDYVVTMK